MKKISVLLSFVLALVASTISMASNSNAVTEDFGYLAKTVPTTVNVNYSIFQFQPDGKYKTGLDFNKIYSKAGDSQTFVKNLSYYGKVSLVSSGGLRTLDRENVPFDLSRESSYPVSVTSDSKVSSENLSNEASAKTVEDLSANFLPVILKDNRILLDFNIDFTNKGYSWANHVATPYTDVQSFKQTVNVKSGDTLILSSFNNFDFDNNANTQMIYMVKPNIEK